jgi:hypothetical protein
MKESVLAGKKCRIRAYEPSDREQVYAMWQKFYQGNMFFDEAWVEPDDEQNFIRIVYEVDGKIVGLGLVRAMAQAQIALDRDFGTPFDRMAIIRDLDDAGCKVLGSMGITELYAHTLWKRYGERLKELGYMPDNDRYAFCKRIERNVV